MISDDPRFQSDITQDTGINHAVVTKAIPNIY